MPSIAGLHSYSEELKMEKRQMTRRTVLERVGKGSLAFLTISVSARSLGLPAHAQVPQKIMIGSQPINPLLASYIGAVNLLQRRRPQHGDNALSSRPRHDSGDDRGQYRVRRYRHRTGAGRGGPRP